MSRPWINALVLGFAIFTIGCALGTQVAAHIFVYHKALGDPLLTISGVPICWPFELFSHDQGAAGGNCFAPSPSTRFTAMGGLAYCPPAGLLLEGRGSAQSLVCAGG